MLSKHIKSSHDILVYSATQHHDSIRKPAQKSSYASEGALLSFSGYIDFIQWLLCSGRGFEDGF